MLLKSLKAKPGWFVFFFAFTFAFAVALLPGTSCFVPNALADTGEEQSIKVLVIGNSYAVDGMDYRSGNGGGHLYQLLSEAGYTDITLGVLDSAASSLQAHLNSANNNSLSYAWHKFESQASPNWTSTLYVTNVTMQYGIEYTDWDVIILQQDNSLSHNESSYACLEELAAYINTHKTNPDARLGWHMTWAHGLQGEASVGGGALIATPQGQLSMYNGIKSAVQNRIAANSAIDFIIPSGIAIQEMRGYVSGSTLIRSNVSQLSYDLGRYTAGMTWLRAITGGSVDAVSYKPASVSEGEQN